MPSSKISECHEHVPARKSRERAASFHFVSSDSGCAELRYNNLTVLTTSEKPRAFYPADYFLSAKGSFACRTPDIDALVSIIIISTVNPF